jgi:uncharacterized protein (TIGR02246 family)
MTSKTSRDTAIRRSGKAAAVLAATIFVFSLAVIPAVYGGARGRSAPRAPGNRQQQAAIDAANQRFMSAFASQDAAAVAALYTEDALLLPPGTDILSGRTAIQGFWQAVMNSGVRGVTLETVELEHYGQALQEIGRYTLTGTGGQVLDRGKYVVIWRHEGSEWLIHRDIFNTNLPAT